MQTRSLAQGVLALDEASEYSGPAARVVEQRKPAQKRSRSRSVLERLREGPASALELQLVGGGTAATSRVRELRNRGFEIETERGVDGVWRYRLVREP